MKDRLMNCKQARANIALWVGHDLDEATCHLLERHLATCPPCRDHRGRMQTGLTVLTEMKCGDTVASADSVWPAVSSRLSACDAALRAPRFNGWDPAIAVAGIFLAIVSIARTPDPAPQFRTAVPSQTAVYPYPPNEATPKKQRRLRESGELYSSPSTGTIPGLSSSPRSTNLD